MHEIDALGRPGALVLGVAGAVYLARVLWVSWRDVREHRTFVRPPGGDAGAGPYTSSVTMTRRGRLHAARGGCT